MPGIAWYGPLTQIAPTLPSIQPVEISVVVRIKIIVEKAMVQRQFKLRINFAKERKVLFTGLR